MKDFCRTTAGKLTLYILFVLCFAVAAVSIIGIVGLAEEDIYTMTPTQFQEEYGSISDPFTAGLYQIGFALRFWAFPIAAVSLIVCVVIYVVLLCAAGKRPGSEELVPGRFFAFPFDLTAAVTLVLIAAAMINCLQIMAGPGAVVFFAVCAVLGLWALLALSMGFASRVKQHALWKNTLIYKILRLLARLGRWLAGLIRSLPLVWRTALIVAVVSFAEFLAVLTGEADSVLDAFWLLEKIILVPLVLYAAVTLRRLEKAGEALASGDLAYRTDTKKLLWDFRRHGENLNRVSDAVSDAVEQRLRSERMKTELITNVSHDIKTPLTSVVNYASLVQSAADDPEKVREYGEVLLRQSEKLKRLLDDLVEASKASTGNLEVTPVPCDAAVFLTQTEGEYAERLEKAGLTLVTKGTDKPLRIMADSRRMWRVFDNLMNNVCKYALPGTRVYLSLEQQGDEAVFLFKNTSREALNLSADELMERFVRGDRARTTEGSGLGLSIARSLTELQGGTMELSVDGDLFKVTLRFPVLL